MTDDVVQDLDAELALVEQLPYRVPIHLLAKRARDEIVAMRDTVPGWVADRRSKIRAEALEEAAQICEAQPNKWACADAIRALKNKRDE